MPTGAEHGGAFWDAIGADFRHLNRRSSIINADVLDAWFPPSPRVIEALKEPSDWLYSTSPPTDAEGMLAAIAQARGVPIESLVLGAGSSDLIFRTFLMTLTPQSRALVPDPTYGEYAHVLENVVGCQVERLPLKNWKVDLDAASQRLTKGEFDLFILVNPNSPTGDALSPSAVAEFARSVPERTMIWVDEAYADYAGITCEGLVAELPNVIVCKSMSKVYALSGLRAGYAVGPRKFIERMWLRTPPWVVSLPGQIAACAALEDTGYYQARYGETRTFRKELSSTLQTLAGDVLLGETNFVLWFLPAFFDAHEVAERCKSKGLYVREAASIGSGLENALRVSVKDRGTQGSMLAIIRGAIR